MTVEFGVCIPNFGNNLSAKGVAEVASEAEEMEYDSVLVTDHLIIPPTHRYPYGKILEILSTMAYLAGLTENVKIGSSVIVLPMREPVQVAKALATIDVVSGGRVIAGFGVGWCEEEYNNVGAAFKNRGKRFDEALQLIKTLWKGGEVSFKGQYYRVETGIFEPKPVQPEGPPIWVGGNSEKAFQRALKIANGWHFTGIPLNQLDQIVAGKKIPNEFVLSGRLTIDFSGKSPRIVKARSGEERVILSGNADQIIEQLSQYVDRGITNFAVYFGDVPHQQYIKDMQLFLKEVIPSYL